MPEWGKTRIENSATDPQGEDHLEVLDIGGKI